MYTVVNLFKQCLQGVVSPAITTEVYELRTKGVSHWADDSLRLLWATTEEVSGVRLGGKLRNNHISIVHIYSAAETCHRNLRSNKSDHLGGYMRI